MTPETLQAAMPGLSLARAQQFLPGCEEALRLIGATDSAHVKRGAQFLAQIGHESVSLIYTEEIADGSAYNGRSDLGNTQPGDGPRYKGRSFIQITGRSNYGSFSRWAYEQKLVTSPTYFVDNPTELASDRWAWIGAVWYWLVARSTLNQYADAGDTATCTRLINGGLNGYDNRLYRYNLILKLGNAILPRTVESIMAKLDNDDRNFIRTEIQGAVVRAVAFMATGKPNALFNPAVAGTAWAGNAATGDKILHAVNLGIVGDAPDGKLDGKGDTHANISNEGIYNLLASVNTKLDQIIAKG